ncbi:cysteine proteinase [Rhizodiscina lignyota]|uniref:Cysteine proteinase n=1 Tax=Rhizodiscina lignyota TaxID=1504668 RepID=A0A9P4ID79_9PEZI|nr:cysteine proteinase [Rhizodiscina lignyota]
MVTITSSNNKKRKRWRIISKKHFPSRRQLHALSSLRHSSPSAFLSRANNLTGSGLLSTHSFPSRFTLHFLLSDQINWAKATDATFETEGEKMAPITRGHKQRWDKFRHQERHERSVREANSRVWKKVPAFARNKQPMGLHNPRNYCYRRAVLQALINTPQILRFITSHNPKALTNSPECSSSGPCAACLLKQVMTEYFKGARPQLDSAVARFDQQFVNISWPAALGPSADDADKRRLRYGQQDAHEFLLFVADYLRQDNRPLHADLYHGLFSVTSRSAWTCPGCGEIHETEPENEFGQIVQIRAPKHGLSVQQYIEHEYAAEDLSGLSCDRCNSKNLDTKRQKVLLAAPDVLVVALRCFDANLNKIISPVILSNRLNLTSLQPVAQRAAFSLKYKLLHVIYHTGKTPNSGHYFGTYTAHSGVHELNDQMVTPDVKLGDIPMGGQTMPYILVYSMVTEVERSPPGKGPGGRLLCSEAASTDGLEDTSSCNW